MIYLIAFVLSSLCFNACEKTHKKIRISNKSYSGRYIYALGGILILSLLAAFRAKTVGTDVMTYVYYAFEGASSKVSLFDAFKNSYLEPLYESLCYISYRLIPDIHFLHFTTAFIIIGCVYIFVNSYKEKISITMSMLCFMFLYFNTTLNIARQYLAIGFALIAVKFLLQGKIKKYLLNCVIAFLFHSSGIITIIYYPLYMFLKKNKGKKYRIIIVVVGTAISLIFLQHVVGILVTIGIMPSQYAGYFTSQGESSIAMQVLSRLPIILLGFAFYNNLDRYDANSRFFYCLLIIDALIGIMTPMIGAGSRFSLYFGIVQIILIPELCRVIETKTKDKLFIRFCFIVYLLAFWIYCFPIRNFSDTYPYVSDIIRWL